MKPEQCRHLFTPHAGYLIAVSGGIDSVSCAHFLAAHGEDFQIRLALAYVHHGLRPEADREVEFVERLAESLKLPFFSARIFLDKGPDLQQRARDARYEALQRLALDNKMEFIVTAHNRDDQAETVLFRLLRGAGATGLGGIQPIAGNLVRPFLSFSRAQIEEYAGRHGLAFMEDSSNAQDHYTRNRLRHAAIPLLSDLMGADVRPALARLAQISRWEGEALEEIAGEDAARAARDEHGGIRLDRAQLAALLPGRRLGLFRHAIKRLQGDVSRLSFAHLTAVDRLVRSGNPSAYVELPGGIVARREYNDLVIEKGMPGEAGMAPVVLDRPGTARFGSWTIALTGPAQKSAAGESGGFAIWLDGAKTGWPLELRQWKPGDRVALRGGKGSKKLSDLFIDAKVPRVERSRIPIVWDREGILWAPGLWVRDGITANELTGEAYCLSVVPVVGSW